MAHHGLKRVEPRNVRRTERATGSFRHYLNTIRPLLDHAFEKSLNQLLDGAEATDKLALTSALNGGKKIRGSLTCLVGEALGAGLESTIPRATAVELIQAATLIHDDFVDQDTVRRNRPAVWTMEGARRAVLIGDVIFAGAIAMMSDMSRNDGMAASQAIAEVSTGALHEPLDPLRLAFLVESGRFNGGLYETIIRLKTAILFGTACQLGAIAAKAKGKTRQAAYRYGLGLGEAYQMVDDVKDIKAHLSKGAVDREQIMALSPAFLRFAADLRPRMPELLRSACTPLDRPLREQFAAAVAAMEQEIAVRTESATGHLDRHLPESDLADLVRTAPLDAIAMFLEEE